MTKTIDLNKVLAFTGSNNTVRETLCGMLRLPAHGVGTAEMIARHKFALFLQAAPSPITLSEDQHKVLISFLSSYIWPAPVDPAAAEFMIDLDTPDAAPVDQKELPLVADPVAATTGQAIEQILPIATPVAPDPFTSADVSTSEKVGETAAVNSDMEVEDLNEARLMHERAESLRPALTTIAVTPLPVTDSILRPAGQSDSIVH